MVSTADELRRLRTAAWGLSAEYPSSHGAFRALDVGFATHGEANLDCFELWTPGWRALVAVDRDAFRRRSVVTAWRLRMECLAHEFCIRPVLRVFVVLVDPAVRVLVSIEREVRGSSCRNHLRVEAV